MLEQEKRYPYDLHVHSINSDGKQLPEDIIQEASGLKFLKGFVFTEHNGVVGETPREMEPFPGVEISSVLQHRGTLRKIHILGYGEALLNNNLPPEITLPTRTRNYALKSALAEIEEDFRVKLPPFELMLKGLQTDGSLMYANKMQASRTVLAECLAKLLNLDASEIKQKYLPPYQPEWFFYPDTKRVISYLRELGCIPVYAHPMGGNTAVKNEGTLFEIIETLKSCGLLGIEVRYSGHTNREEETLRKIAEHYNLLLFGGSDYHGKEKVSLGQGGVLEPELDEIRDTLVKKGKVDLFLHPMSFTSQESMESILDRETKQLARLKNSLPPGGVAISGRNKKKVEQTVSQGLSHPDQALFFLTNSSSLEQIRTSIPIILFHSISLEGLRKFKKEKVANPDMSFGEFLIANQEYLPRILFASPEPLDLNGIANSPEISKYQSLLEGKQGESLPYGKVEGSVSLPPHTIKACVLVGIDDIESANRFKYKLCSHASWLPRDQWRFFSKTGKQEKPLVDFTHEEAQEIADFLSCLATVITPKISRAVKLTGSSPEDNLDWEKLSLKAIVFDLSDTLLFTFKPAYEKLCQIAKWMNLPSPNFETYKYLYRSSAGLTKTIEVLFSGRLNPQEAIRLYTSEEMKNLFPYRPVSMRTNSLLTDLAHAGFQLGIVSNEPNSKVIDKLKWAGINSNLFSYIQGTEEGIAKPKKGCFDPLFENLQLKPEQILYIGDSLIDFRAARNYKMPFLAVSKGPFEPEEFLAMGLPANFIRRDIEECLTLVLNSTP